MPIITLAEAKKKYEREYALPGSSPKPFRHQVCLGISELTETVERENGCGTERLLTTSAIDVVNRRILVTVVHLEDQSAQAAEHCLKAVFGAAKRYRIKARPSLRPSEV
jgi:hypothetical protein